MFMFTVVTTVAANYHDHDDGIGVGGAIAIGVAGMAVWIDDNSRRTSSFVQHGVSQWHYVSTCGSTWYQPQYSGSQVNYIVVNPPR